MVVRARLIAPLALAGLTVVAAMSLARVFETNEFVAPVLVCALVPHLVGALARGRRWSPAWTALGSFVGLLLVLTWVTAPDHSLYGLPTLDTLKAFGDHAREGWDVIRGNDNQQIPVDDGPLLLAMATTWLVAALSDELAFRSRATLGAATPALVLLVFSSSIGVHRSQALYAATFGAAAALLLMLQSAAVLDRRRSWLATRTPANRSALTRTMVVAPIALGLLALGVAPSISAALPGHDAEGVFGNRRGLEDLSLGPRGTPFVDLQRELKTGAPFEVFSVRSPQGTYWRMDVLDRLEPGGAGEWTSTVSGRGQRLGRTPATGSSSGLLAQQFTIGDISGAELPAAFEAVAIDLDNVEISSESTLRTTTGSVRALSYTVRSRPRPTEAEITPAQRAATAGSPAAVLDRYLQLPDDLPASVAQRARTVVLAAGATTPYDKAKALRDYLRGPEFQYDLDVERPTGDAIASFLDKKRGYCQHFASAYTAMARSQGIPTRIAVGYTQGQLKPDGLYHVTQADAHAWPEIWLAGLGWVALFDPTPQSADSGGSALPGEVLPTTVTTTAPTATAPGGAGGSTAPTSTPATTPPDEPASTTGWARGPVLVALVLVLAIGAYAGTILALKARHRARRRAVVDPARAVGSAWASALEELAEARIPVDPALTPLEVARRTPARGRPETAAPLRRLARAYTAVRYGERTPDLGDVEAAWSSVDELRQVLGTGVETRERWRRRLDRRVLRRSTTRP